MSLISRKAMPCQHSYTVPKALISFTNNTTAFFADLLNKESRRNAADTPMIRGSSKQFWKHMDPTKLFKLAALPDESLPHSEQLFTDRCS